MNHSILISMIVIALMQSGSWLIRKLFTKQKKFKSSKSLIIAESILITIILFSYIFYVEDANKIKEDIISYSNKDWGYLILTALCVTGALSLIFHIMPQVELSKLSPSLSIIRIIILTVLGFLLLGESITMRKIIALIFMITGIFLLMKS